MMPTKVTLTKRIWREGQGREEECSSMMDFGKERLSWVKGWKGGREKGIW